MATGLREGAEMNWFSRKLKIWPTPEDTAEREAFVAETKTKIAEVSKLREDVLEGRNFPIATFLQGRPVAPARARRVRPHG